MYMSESLCVKCFPGLLLADEQEYPVKHREAPHDVEDVPVRLAVALLQRARDLPQRPLQHRDGVVLPGALALRPQQLLNVADGLADLGLGGYAVVSRDFMAGKNFYLEPTSNL